MENRGKSRGIVILFTAVLLGLPFQHVSADTLFIDSTPPEDQARKIFAQIQAGVLPIADGSRTSYYTGPCVGLSASINPNGSHYAILGLRKEGATFYSTWWLSYDNSDTPSPNPYLDLDYARATRLYPANRAAVIEENHLRTNVSEDPLLYSIFAADPAQPRRKISIAGLHVGPMYCELDAMDL